MSKLMFSLLAGSLLLAACAVPKQPVPLSPVDPSSPEAREAAEGPPAPSLTTSAEKPPTPRSDPPKPADERMHQQPGQQPPTPSETPETTALYACPMHPEIKQEHPGRCSLCGMPLARRKAEKEPPR